MNENYNINEVNKLPKASSKDVLILTIFICLFLLICAFGVYGFISNLKSNENGTNVDSFEAVLPEKNDKFTFLNYKYWHVNSLLVKYGIVNTIFCKRSCFNVLYKI